MSLARRADDLHAARDRIDTERATSIGLLEDAIAVAGSDAHGPVFLRLFERSARAAAETADRLRAAAVPPAPLRGLAVSVKDLFDVAGQPTTAGSAVLAQAPPALRDCAAVARLRAAGAALVGHTNLTEFAFSGVGLNPHHGTPPNPMTLTLDATPRIPGGSTSGGAVSVAVGAAWAALGSDTGGSIRIPAALQGLVGFKNTQRLTPLDGTVPLAPSLDTACAITRSVRDAVLLHEVLAARHVALQHRPLAQWRLAVPSRLMRDDVEPEVARTFEQALERLRLAGASLVDLPLAELDELSSLNAGGGLAAAESWAWHRGRLARDGARYDPRVAGRIRRGEALSAADYIDLCAARRDWIGRVESAVAPFDALLSPTVPLRAPPIAALRDDDAAFFAANARLLRNPSVINFLDGCALSLPCHTRGDWPAGLMLWAPGGHDDTLLSVSLAVEAALAVED